MDRLKRPFIYLIIVMILAGIVYYATGCSNNADSNSPSGTSSQSSGKDMTDFSTITIDGDEVDQSIFVDDELTMVNFWATFCGPCIDEMPDLADIYHEREGTGFNIVGIILDVQDNSFVVKEEMSEQAQSIIKTTGADYKHLLLSEDIVKDMVDAYSIQSIPTTVFVDSTGKVVSSPYIGSRSKADWDDIIDGIIDN